MKKMISLMVAIAVGIIIGDNAIDLIDKTFTAKPVYKLENLPPFVRSENGVYNEVTGSSSLVRIHNKKGEFVCSGTVVSSKYVLTAAHCLIGENYGLNTKEDYVIHTTLGDGSVVLINSKAASVNTRTDNGLILGDFTGISTVKLALGNLSSLQWSANVGLCGFPQGSKEDICYITDSGYTQYYFSMATKGFLYPGMSGGPVFDMEQKLQLGVNSTAGKGYVVVTNLVGLFESLGVVVNE